MLFANVLFSFYSVFASIYFLISLQFSLHLSPSLWLYIHHQLVLHWQKLSFPILSQSYTSPVTYITSYPRLLNNLTSANTHILSSTHAGIRPSPLHTHHSSLSHWGTLLQMEISCFCVSLWKRKLELDTQTKAGLQKCDPAPLLEGFKCSFSSLCPQDSSGLRNMWTLESAILLLNLRTWQEK